MGDNYVNNNFADMPELRAKFEDIASSLGDKFVLEDILNNWEDTLKIMNRDPAVLEDEVYFLNRKIKELEEEVDDLEYEVEGHVYNIDKLEERIEYMFDLDLQDLINLVKSVNPKSMQECDDYTKIGLMKFTGNQWNENWDWVEDALKNLDKDELFELYKKHK